MAGEVGCRADWVDLVVGGGGGPEVMAFQGDAGFTFGRDRPGRCLRVAAVGDQLRLGCHGVGCSATG